MHKFHIVNVPHAVKHIGRFFNCDLYAVRVLSSNLSVDLLKEKLAEFHCSEVRHYCKLRNSNSLEILMNVVDIDSAKSDYFE